MTTNEPPANAIDDEIHVPNAPPIPGLRFRGLRRPDDFEALSALSNASGATRASWSRARPRRWRTTTRTSTGTDLERDVLVVEIDGRIVAYGRVEWFDTNAGERGYLSFCAVPREVRGRGIGSAMLDWQEARLREIAAGQATDRPRFLVDVRSRDATPTIARWPRRAATQRVRVGHEMVRPDLDAIADAPLPDGIEIRTATREQSRAIWEALVRGLPGPLGRARRVRDGVSPVRRRPARRSLALGRGLGRRRDRGRGAELHSGRRRAGSPRRLPRFGLGPTAVAAPGRREGDGRREPAPAARRRVRQPAGLGVDSQNDNRALELYESAGFAVTATEYEYRQAAGVRTEWGDGEGVVRGAEQGTPGLRAGRHTSRTGKRWTGEQSAVTPEGTKDERAHSVARLGDAAAGRVERDPAVAREEHLTHACELLYRIVLVSAVGRAGSTRLRRDVLHPLSTASWSRLGSGARGDGDARSPPSGPVEVAFDAVDRPRDVVGVGSCRAFTRSSTRRWPTPSRRGPPDDVPRRERVAAGLRPSSCSVQRGRAVGGGPRA